MLIALLKGIIVINIDRRGECYSFAFSASRLFKAEETSFSVSMVCVEHLSSSLPAARIAVFMYVVHFERRLKDRAFDVKIPNRQK